MGKFIFTKHCSLKWFQAAIASTDFGRKFHEILSKATRIVNSDFCSGMLKCFWFKVITCHSLLIHYETGKIKKNLLLSVFKYFDVTLLWNLYRYARLSFKMRDLKIYFFANGQCVSFMEIFKKLFNFLFLTYIFIIINIWTPYHKILK